MSHPAITRFIEDLVARMDHLGDIIIRAENIRAEKLDREILALEEMARRDEDGVSISFAFGGHEFFYEIWVCPEEEELVLKIDAYQAADHSRSNCPAFDADEWAARQIILTAPPTRANFQLMARIARTVIRGGTAEINGGTVSLEGFKAGADL